VHIVFGKKQVFREPQLIAYTTIQSTFLQVRYGTLFVEHTVSNLEFLLDTYQKGRIVMTKAFGRDINEFYNNYFPKHHHIDEYDEELMEKYETDEELQLPDTEKFDLICLTLA
jgi:hypothetical protein